jgi:hypothetical protein
MANLFGPSCVAPFGSVSNFLRMLVAISSATAAPMRLTEPERTSPVPRRIEHLAGIGIAREKALQTHDVWRILGPDQDRAAGARLDQRGPAQDQSAEDAVVQFGLGNHNGPQLLGRDEKRFHIFECVNVHSAGRPESCPTSATKLPVPCSTIGARRPSGLRRVTFTRPVLSTKLPGAISPVTKSG